MTLPPRLMTADTTPLLSRTSVILSPIQPLAMPPRSSFVSGSVSLTLLPSIARFLKLTCFAASARASSSGSFASPSAAWKSHCSVRPPTVISNAPPDICEYSMPFCMSSRVSSLTSTHSPPAELILLMSEPSTVLLILDSSSLQRSKASSIAVSASSLISAASFTSP